MKNNSGAYIFLVRHAPTLSDFSGKGDPNKITARSKKIADVRARRFIDTPVAKINTSPTERAKLVAQDIHKYTGAPVRSEWSLSPWYIGNLTGKANLTAAEKSMLFKCMTANKTQPCLNGDSYMYFLIMLLPYIRSVQNEAELVCVTHRSDICAVMAWDAAGREGVSQDEGVLKNLAALDDIQILELTADSCTPLVVEPMDIAAKVV